MLASSDDITPQIAFDTAGLVLGARTRLAPVNALGELSLDPERVEGLLSIAFRRMLSPRDFSTIEAAATNWRRGEKAIANLRLVFADLPQLDDAPEDVVRLKAAEILFDAGLRAEHLAQAFPDALADDLGKYDPNQPRVPAGSGATSGRWTDGLWARLSAWLDEEVPEYDHDTGDQVGTRSRARAIATNPLTWIGAAGVLLAGGEVLGGGAVITEVAAPTIEASAPAVVDTTAAVGVPDILAALPDGMSLQSFGKIVGFSQGLKASSQASVATTLEAVNELRAAGVTSRAISLVQRFYAEAAAKNPNNLSAIHRAAKLAELLRVYR